MDCFDSSLESDHREWMGEERGVEQMFPQSTINFLVLNLGVMVF